MHLRAWVDCLFVCDVSVMGPSCSPGSSRLCDRLHPGAAGECPTGHQRCIDRGISGQATRCTAPVDSVGQKPAVPYPGGNVCGACAKCPSAHHPHPMFPRMVLCCASSCLLQRGRWSLRPELHKHQGRKSCQRRGTNIRSRTHFQTQSLHTSSCLQGSVSHTSSIACHAHGWYL